MSPPTNCLSPIGPDAMIKGLFSLFDPGEFAEDEFFVTSETRSPAVYRGNPFQVEVGIVHGKGLQGDTQAEVFRFANRVPLQYQFGACAVTKAVTSLNWRQYHLQQPRGGLDRADGGGGPHRLGVGPVHVGVQRGDCALSRDPRWLAGSAGLRPAPRHTAAAAPPTSSAALHLNHGLIAEALDEILKLPEGENWRSKDTSKRSSPRPAETSA